MRGTSSSLRSTLKSCALRHTSSRGANLDRYIAIWRFFKRESSSKASQVGSRCTYNLRTEPRLYSEGLLRSQAISSSRIHFRTFHISLTNYNEKRVDAQRPSPSNKEVFDEKGKGKESTAPPQTQDPYQHLENYSTFFRRLAMSLPPMQRPTRDDLLNVATNFWQRLRIRFKWMTIRSFRKFSADEVFAFFTWFLMSQTVWILVGTTTFFSAFFATVNSLRLQEYIARAISDYLTSETGITIIFESAIVPKWKDSRIAFKNVYISRRPPSLENVASPFDSNAVHRSASRYDIGNHPASHGLDEDHFMDAPEEALEKVDYALFDLTVDSIDVTLSLWRWLDGKGLVKDATVKGVRGIFDRRFVHWDPEKPLDPKDFRHPSRPGDFELESFQVEDLLVTIYQPSSFRPHTFSIFRADLKTFRKRWLFYDTLSADNIVGQFDNCLYSLHKPQSIGRTTEGDLKDTNWSRMTRFRIDGVNIDHLQRSTTMEGPISWITSGKFDAVFDIRFPLGGTDQLDFNELLGNLAEAIADAAQTQTQALARLVERIPGQRELTTPPISAPEPVLESTLELEDDRAMVGDGSLSATDASAPALPPPKPRVVSIDIDLRFRDVKASVPLFTNDLSYVNNALIRPIVAFINANKTLVPIHCRVVKDISEFDGSWTMWETGLMDEMALKIYEALAYHVTHANFNRRMRTVGLWSLQKTIEAALAAVQTMAQPMIASARAVSAGVDEGEEEGLLLVEWAESMPS